MTTKAICGYCNHYGECEADPLVKAGNPWRCIARLVCVKREQG